MSIVLRILIVWAVVSIPVALLFGRLLRRVSESYPIPVDVRDGQR